MKKYLLIFSFMLHYAGKAQTVSNFENLNLLSAGFWNGSDFLGGFTSGNASFNNVYDTAFGGSWSGWAGSRLKDTLTPGFNNQYSCMADGGFGGSLNFAVGYVNYYAGVYPTAKLTGSAKGKVVSGCMVTNNTYAYYDMKNGSSFSKKFGGPQGTDSDYFKLIATGYVNGKKVPKPAEFMLADYTSNDSTKDYIVKNWTWFDLTSLGNVDSIVFTLMSTDTGSFGMNTPAYFCMDNFTTADVALGVSDLPMPEIAVYPNPAQGMIYTSVRGNEYTYKLFQISGAIHSQGTLNSGQIDLAGLAAGSYIIEISSHSGYSYHKICVR